ncbi:MAG: nucleoside kinase [Prevotellaceae bacterium]|jgi:uridine kinase|nr:nucleoside kinase [Prevotellaceae bacterium]
MKFINIYCENNGITKAYEPGVSLLQVAQDQNIRLASAILAALANNQLKELWYEVSGPQTVRFIDYAHPDGKRCYQRSLTFLLQKAIKDTFPECSLSVEHSVSNGFYCELKNAPDFSASMVTAIAKRMRELVAADLPFEKTKALTEEAIAIFQKQGYAEKARLQQTRGKLYTSVYYLDGYADHFYGPLAPSTGALSSFGLTPYYNGMLLMFPKADNPAALENVIIQKKMFDIFQEHKLWVDILQAGAAGQINELIQHNGGDELIKVSEALHEKKYAQIADHISLRRGDIKLALIAGPSSSGKTTTSKRLSIQLKVAGFMPKVLEMDNYFVNRDQTPLDEHGEHDFESVNAVDLDLFNAHLDQLLHGKRVLLPKFNFDSGMRSYNGAYMELGEKDILIVEGIHALNPKLTEAISLKNKLRIYASALTFINLDENNRISTTDNRLVRRLVRDAFFRGTGAQATLHRWASVRRGEDKNIFPFQENADIMFNSSLLYELNVLRKYAEPMLYRVLPNDAAYAEACRLLKFLSYFELINPECEREIPSTSVIREFIGGSSFSYQ